jgi:hypothetical protein
VSKPTLIVELDRGGFIGGAQLDDEETGLLDSAVLGPVAATFDEDITEFVRGVETHRGAQRELERVEAGTATITLANDGRFTPFNTGSPYYPDVLPMRRIRILAQFPPEIPLATPPTIGVVATIPTPTIVISAFVPSDIAGLVAWYDFSDITTLWKDTARTSAVTADADIIKGVTDKSGNGKHLSEATNGPAYKVGIINSQSVARFDGTNDRLTNTSMAADTSFTVFLVAQKRSAPDATNRPLFGVTDGASGDAQLYTKSTDGHGAGYGWYSGLTTIGGTAANVSIIALRITSAASLDIYPNGGAPVNLNPADLVTTGTQYEYGSSQAGANFGDFDIAEVAAWDSALSSTDMNSAGPYFAAKWAATWTPI